jgi:hypothetical protein
MDELEVLTIKLQALREQQAKERAELVANLNATRHQRAWEAATAEQRQPPAPHPDWIIPSAPSFDNLLKRHEHNLGIRDERDAQALDKSHEITFSPLEQERKKLMQAHALEPRLHQRDRELEPGAPKGRYDELKQIARTGVDAPEKTLAESPQKLPEQARQVEDDAKRLEGIRAKIAAEREKENAVEPGKLPDTPPQTHAAEKAHERVTEEKAADADRRRLEEIRARLAAEREKGRQV